MNAQMMTNETSSSIGLNQRGLLILPMISPANVAMSQAARMS